MARYYVIEMWESQEVPSFSTTLVDNESKVDVFTTDSLQEAIEEQVEMQDGYILDFKERLIIKV